MAIKNYYNWSHYKSYKCEAEKSNKAKKLCKTDFEDFLFRIYEVTWS